VTISCLLIQPNPASALNEAAGKLAVEDWDGYCRRAKLMTEIHAAIPSSIAKAVREAQMRGEEQTTEPEPQSTAKPHSKGKEKERVKVTPAGPRLQRQPSEDEENRRRRGATHDADSDPESDWIPGPIKMSKVPAHQEANIFGIKGLEDTMQLDTPPKRIFAAESKAPAFKIKAKGKANIDDSDPFVTAHSKSNTQPSTTAFDLSAPPILTTSTSRHPSSFAASSSSQNHPTQDTDNYDLLMGDFSISWLDNLIMRDKGSMVSDVKKRIASEEFEAKRRWEMKKFKQAGCDLKKFNRGEFGARVGVRRL
jgi:ubiquitin-conjugating enzyme E2 S